MEVVVIRNFKDEETAKIANGERSRKRPIEIQAKAYRLLRIMARIDDWNDLRYPPGNKLHALAGNRAGQYAIWTNQQWRIAFTPIDGMMTDVEITDYH